jgi:polyhydroxyalkanoate synthesis regulator phasin
MASEGLAALINETMTSKEDIKAVKEDVAAWHSEMNQKFEAVESRLGRIESLLMEEQKRKIEHLETRMKKLEDALAV